MHKSSDLDDCFAPPNLNHPCLESGTGTTARLEFDRKIFVRLLLERSPPPPLPLPLPLPRTLNETPASLPHPHGSRTQSPVVA